MRVTSTIKALRLLGFLLGVWAVDAAAQGSLKFANLDPAVGLDAPTYLSLFPMPQTLPPGYLAQLLVGPALNRMRNVWSISLTNGYINAGTVTVPYMPPGASAWCVVQVFRGDYGSFANAYATEIGFSCGTSGPFKVVLGGSGTPPSPPAALVGLTSFDVDLDNWDYEKPTLQASFARTNGLTFWWMNTANITWRYVLRQTSDLKSPHWVNVPSVLEYDGHVMSVTIPPPTGTMFYRLFLQL